MRSGKSRRLLGSTGERLAAQELAARGLSIVQANYRCAAGEMDLIVRSPEELVFVEVKTRRGDRYGIPEEAVNSRKQQRLVEVAETYLQEHGLIDERWRIDVVAVEMDSRGRLVRIEVIENAVGR